MGHLKRTRARVAEEDIIAPVACQQLLSLDSGSIQGGLLALTNLFESYGLK